jgi:hypothetical protein
VSAALSCVVSVISSLLSDASLRSVEVAHEAQRGDEAAHQMLLRAVQGSKAGGECDDDGAQIASDAGSEPNGSTGGDGPQRGAAGGGGQFELSYDREWASGVGKR